MPLEEGGIVIESLESKRMKKKIEQDLRTPIEYRGPRTLSAMIVLINCQGTSHPFPPPIPIERGDPQSGFYFRGEERNDFG